MRRLPPWMKSKPLVSLVTLVLLLALMFGAEGATRLVARQRCREIASTANALEHDLRRLRPCFRREQRKGEPWLVPTPLEGLNDNTAERRLHKPADAIRIAVVGESSAQQLQLTLERVLERRTGGRPYEILPCAVPGAARVHVERRFDEVLEYGPDAIVVMFGHNTAFRARVDEQTLRAQWLRSRSCLLSMFATPAQAAPPAGESEDPVALLEQFLRRAATSARARNIRLVVTTMAGNLWVAPGHRASDDDAPELLEAKYLESVGRRSDALHVLSPVASKSADPYLHYRLGTMLARAGDPSALGELQRALDEDSMRLRATSRVNDVIRRVAGDERLSLRDTEKAVLASAPGGLPGFETFVDNCHLWPERMDVEAAAILASVRETLGVAPDAFDPTPFTSGVHKDLTDVLVGVSRLGEGPMEEVFLPALPAAIEVWSKLRPTESQGSIAAFVDGAELAALSTDRRARVLASVAEGLFLSSMPERALAVNVRARELGGAAEWVQLGLFQLRQGNRADARSSFERALQLEPGRVDARFFLERTVGG